MAATIALGIAFLVGTAVEWRELINEHHLTISRNLFGTTYYTLVGFHGLHVTVGVVAMLIVLALSLGREVTLGIARASSWSPGTGTSSMRFGSSCSWWSMSRAGAARHDNTNRIPPTIPPRSTCPSRLLRRWCWRSGSCCWRWAWPPAWRFCSSAAFVFVVGLGNVDRSTLARPRPLARAARRAFTSVRNRSRLRQVKSNNCGMACPAIDCGCR